MTDFVQVSKDDFFHDKCYVDQHVNDKVKSLLDKFNCFDDFVAFSSYNKTRKPHHHHHHPHHHNHHQHTNGNQAHAKKRAPVINKNLAKSDRDFLSMLNKISPANFGTISQKLLVFINADNSTKVVNGILEKCYKQHVYLDTYIKLLQDIKSKAPNEVRETLSCVVCRFINEFIQDTNFENYHLNSVDYDTFCVNVCNKKTILGKHRTVVKLFDKILDDPTSISIDGNKTNEVGKLMDLYFAYMLNAIKNIGVLDAVEQENAHGHFDKIELMLEMLEVFMKYNTKYSVSLGEFYKSQSDVLPSYSMKAKFKVMDMLS